MLIRRRKLLKRSPVLNKRSKMLHKRHIANAPLYSDTPWYWRYVIGDSEICYVCDRRIASRTANKYKVYIGRHPFNGARLYRHSQCHPQTERWRNKFGDSHYFRDRYQRWREKKASREENMFSKTTSLLNDEPIIKLPETKKLLRRK